MREDGRCSVWRLCADALCAARCIAVYRDARDLLDHYEASPLAGKAAQTSN